MSRDNSFIIQEEQQAPSSKGTTQTSLTCNSTFSEPGNALEWLFDKSHVHSKYFTANVRSLWLHSNTNCCDFDYRISRAHLESKAPLHFSKIKALR